MPLGTTYPTQGCSAARALEVVGERWTLLIVRDLLWGLRRFSDLRRDLGIPRAVLVSRLESLAAAGVVARVGTTARPEYELTAAGRDLWPAVHALHGWGEAHATTTPGRRTWHHADCGTELAPGGWCPACRRPTTPDVVDVRPGPGLDAAAHAAGPLPDGPHRLLTPLRT